MLGMGRAAEGIDVDAVDGVPGWQVVSTESARAALLEAKDRGSLLDALQSRT